MYSAHRLMWPPRDKAKAAIISDWPHDPKYFCSKNFGGILKVAAISGWPHYPVATLSGEHCISN